MWIPSDSSLVLGAVVDDERIRALQEVAELQKLMETAQDNHNAHVRNKLSIDMSMQELRMMRMGNDSNTVQETLKKLEEASEQQEMYVMESLLKLVTERQHFENAYVTMMEKREQTKIGLIPESPLDLDASPLNSLPIGTPSLQMDVQYFKCESGYQGSAAHVSKIVSYTRRITDRYRKSSSKSSSLSDSDVESHVNRQVETNRVVGTLVISAQSTHKLANFYDANYDPLKLLRAWNMKVQDEMIDLPGRVEEHFEEWTKKKDIYAGDNENEVVDEPKIAVITGQTYGSAFIGFIHFVRIKGSYNIQRTEKNSRLPPGAKAAKLKMDKQHWWNSWSGQWGMDGSTASEVKNLMSSNSIRTHLSVQTYGIIPSIASTDVKSTIKQFAKFDAAATNEKLALMASKDDAQAPPVIRNRRRAVRAGQIKGIQRAKIRAVMSSCEQTDELSNQELDMNTMMQAFDDYTAHVKEADGGTPLSYFVTSLRKADVIGEWMKKYRPEYYKRAIQGEQYRDMPRSDDSDDSRSDDANSED